MNELQPYSPEELRRIRRLIIACGTSVEEWAARLRRTADFLQSLSPGQAQIVSQQALAIAADPADCGDGEEMLVMLEELATIPEGERLKYLSRHVIEVRRRYFPGVPDEE